MSRHTGATELMAIWLRGALHVAFLWIEIDAVQALPVGAPQLHAEHWRSSCTPWKKMCCSVNVFPGMSLGQGLTPFWKMHALKPAGSGSEMQIDRSIRPLGIPVSHPRANVSQRNETTFAATGGPGAQPFSVIAIGSIVREWAAPLGVWVVLSQLPFQEAGASNEVVTPGVPHTAVLAVSVDGSAQDPVGGSQVHASQMGRATRSVRPL